MRNEEIAYKRGFRVDVNGNVYNNENEKVIVSVNNNGYKIFGTGSKKKQNFKNIYVHRLQAYMKYGSYMYTKKVVRHLDGDKLNNQIQNIVIGSYVDNYHDIPKMARKKIVAKMSRTKRQISDEEIKEIFRMRSAGLYYRQISKKMNISKSWICQILNRKTSYEEVIINL